MESKVQAAIDTILEDKKSYETSLNYAVGYCRAAKGLTGKELRVQVLYILSNIQYWRHPKAKEVRKTLKQFAEIK